MHVLHSDCVISFSLMPTSRAFPLQCMAVTNQFTENFPTEEGSTISKWFTRFSGNTHGGRKKISGSRCCPKSDIHL